MERTNTKLNSYNDDKNKIKVSNTKMKSVSKVINNSNNIKDFIGKKYEYS